MQTRISDITISLDPQKNGNPKIAVMSGGVLEEKSEKKGINYSISISKPFEVSEINGIFAGCDEKPTTDPSRRE